MARDRMSFKIGRFEGEAEGKLAICAIVLVIVLIVLVAMSRMFFI